MIESDVIIVGAGPAGSTCAWRLKKAGISVRLLDKQEFPREKPCAGWITPGVLSRLEIDPNEYPYSIRTSKSLHIHIKGLGIPLPTKQYFIRRYELDNWLKERSGVYLHHHQVKNIVKQNGSFIIDNIFSCKYLVGAGGTGCPVYHTFFKPHQPRSPLKRITTLEEEFPYPIKDERCYLWFFDHGLPGYAWYVPKENGYLNIGIGGKLERIKKKGKTIKDFWNLFTRKLERRSLVNRSTYHPKGYNYFLRNRQQIVQRDSAYIIGDAAGLATIDMGEGIGPAVESGNLVADSIVNEKPFFLQSISRYSFKEILFPSRKTRN